MRNSSKILLRLTGALLAALTVLSFAACDLSKDTPEDDSESVTDSGAVEQIQSLTIFSGGKTDFKIIYPEECDESIFTAAKNIVGAFKSIGGVDIAYEGDFVKRGETPDSNALEILIGDTNRPESQLQEEKLIDESGYIITVEGNKLVIYGNTASATVDAVNYFVRYYVREPAALTDSGKLDTLTVTSKDEYIYQREFAIKSLTINGVELSEHRIVVPEDSYVETYIAQLLNKHISRYYGRPLEIVTDKEAPAANEVLIGKTNRSTVTAEDGKYRVKVTEKGLEAIAPTVMGYADVLTALQKKVMPNTKSATALKTDDEWTDDASGLSLTASGDVTVIYHNVLGYQPNDYPISNRPLLAAQVYEAYGADVICFEEFGNEFRHSAGELIMWLADSGYVEVSGSSGVGNPIFYNSKTVSLIEKGYEASKDVADKGTTWVVLEVKSGENAGKRFAVTNSHFAATSNASGDADLANQYRISNAQTAVDVTESIKTEYTDIPIFVGGDFNSRPDSDPYAVLTESGLTNVRELAVKSTEFSAHNEHPKYNSDTDYYELGSFKAKEASDAIDHIMAGGDLSGVTLLEYAISKDKISCTLSDHLPQLLSFDFN